MITYLPYTYIIGWSSHKIYYYGCEVGIKTKIANPQNLWTTYFTSSSRVKDFRKTHGEPDIIRICKVFETANEALVCEAGYLSRINAAGRSNWLNMHNGGKCFTTAGYVTITDGKSQRCIPQSDPIPDGWKKGVSDKSKANRKKASQNRNWWFPSTAYEKSKQVVTGKKIINNGITVTIHDPSLPLPDGYVYGQLPENSEAKSKRLMGHTHSEDTKTKIGDKARGRKASEETKKKMSDARIGKKKKIRYIWITNGEISIQHLATDDIIPDGFWRGRIVPKEWMKNRSNPPSEIYVWITNGNENHHHNKNEPIPDGYRLGKVHKPHKQKKLDTHKLYHPKHGVVITTIPEFESVYDIARKTFFRLQRGIGVNKSGWVYITKM